MDTLFPIASGQPTDLAGDFGLSTSKFLTIITPTFNRVEWLPRLYKSLKSQSVRDFEWLIVDDGSSDETPDFCSAVIQEAAIAVRVIRKANGGKHTALNAGIAAVVTELIFIVDSDDYLTPNAVSRIQEVWSRYKGEGRSGISFMRGTSEEEPLGHRFPRDNEVSSYIEMRFNRGIKGDKAEIYRSDVLKRFRFPEFKGEKFLAEDAVWAPIGLQYQMVHINEIIYVGNYLEAGLTAGGKSFMLRCPNGAIESVKWFLSRKVRMRVRAPMAWRYLAYGLFAKRPLIEHICSSELPLFVTSQIPGGLALYVYWRHKFRNEIANASGQQVRTPKAANK